jgi:hypothetical protein
MSKVDPLLTVVNDRNPEPELKHSANVADALNNDSQGVTLVIPAIGSNYD